MRNATKEEMKSVHDYIDSISQTLLSIPIPKNATNGDMIKTMFPDDEETPEFVYEDMVFYGKGNYDRTWWNAPYKAESEVKI